MRIPILLMGATALLAQAPASPKTPKTPYVPNAALWKLDLENPIGGWTTQKEVDLRFKVTDPKDPDPPKPAADRREEDEEDGSRSYDGLRQAENESWEDFHVRWEAHRQANAWRDRVLLVYFNGAKETRSIRVGYDQTLNLKLQDGENRLELRLPEGGQSKVMSVFAFNARDRLVVRLTSPDAEPTQYYWGWYSGGLQVIEPDHTESIGGEPTPSGGRNNGSTFTHSAPLPGTYTVRWFDPRAGVDGYGYDSYYQSSDVKPSRIVAEVVLNPGTDQERRWRFEQLVVPGTKRITLGSFDVED